MIGNPVYRQSYIEKDRCVRNSTVVQVPGVDVMQGFELSKDEFEQVFMKAADNYEESSRQLGVPKSSGSDSTDPTASSGKLGATAEERPPLARTTRLNRQQRKAARRKEREAAAAEKAAAAAAEKSRAAAPVPAGTAGAARPFRGQAPAPERTFATADDAAEFADASRRDGAALQRATPSDYEGAGALFERAIDTRAKCGLFCTQENADAHVEYAQNLSKRGLTPEAEYHLRTAADIFRMLNARAARKYGDVLLYMAVVIDRQGRLAEAENFYRSALAVYRANKLSDDNVRVAIDSLSNNLRAQGRAEEVDTIVQRHFLGAVA